ncbi:MAG TPA: TIGR01841 family phasin [Acetobacteraceae bacterium]|nr:TIGR01841 family phasin [Acetobacteraceae bacterium]
MALGPIPDFSDFTRMFAEMKIPALPDMDAFATANRRNIETFTAANRVALEGAQAVARRHMEIMQQSMSEMTDAIRTLSATDAPQVRAAKQAELLKQGYERAVGNLKEISELIQHSHAEAMNLLNRRFVEAMEELKALAEKSARA